MSIAYNSSGITRELVASFDVGNRKSYIESAGSQRSFLTITPWTTGTGGVTPYNQNGLTEENQRLVDTDPWGNQSIVWQSNPTGATNDDGGWNTDGFTIDPTKMYRHSIWMRRTSATTGGTFYFGTAGNVKRMDTSAVETNPYWSCANIGAYTQNQWYLFVGHTYPWNTTYTGKHPDTGYWVIYNNSIVGKYGDISCNVGSGDVKWEASTTNYTIHRTYHYYCGDATSHCQWASPRIDLIDGTEPSVTELLLNGISQLKDLTGTIPPASIVANPAYSRTNGGYLTFNGSTQYLDLGNPAALQLATSITMTAWINPSAVTLSGNIVSKNYNSAYRFRIGTDNSLWWYVSGTAAVSAANLVPNNTWTHVAVTGDGTGLRCFVNGVQVAYNSTAYAPASPATGNAYVGCYGPGSEQFIGNIATLQIYSRALSAAELLTLFNAGRKRFGV